MLWISVDLSMFSPALGITECSPRAQDGRLRNSHKVNLTKFQPVNVRSGGLLLPKSVYELMRMGYCYFESVLCSTIYLIVLPPRDTWHVFGTRQYPWCVVQFSVMSGKCSAGCGITLSLHLLWPGNNTQTERPTLSSWWPDFILF